MKRFNVDSVIVTCNGPVIKTVTVNGQAPKQQARVEA